MINQCLSSITMHQSMNFKQNTINGVVKLATQWSHVINQSTVSWMLVRTPQLETIAKSELAVFIRQAATMAPTRWYVPQCRSFTAGCKYFNIKLYNQTQQYFKSRFDGLLWVIKCMRT